jgi:thiamine-monophosphate kinase
MDEFSLIETYFKPLHASRDDVILGIGDDAACLRVLPNHHLVVSSDTLVADVHFLSSWDAYDIAYKAVMVNVSDIAAMAATPCWVTLALTLPKIDTTWLTRFSKGLSEALNHFNIALVGGDTTRGPLSMTLTMFGVAKGDKILRRSGAKSGDKIYVSGALGAAAFAVTLTKASLLPQADIMELMHKLQHPYPRIDLGANLQIYATAGIDISDGLAADLNHICEASQVGACLNLAQIPIHPLVQQYQPHKALDFALHGGDDYELCFTINPTLEAKFLASMAAMKCQCYPIGSIETQLGLRGRKENSEVIDLKTFGYRHF